MTAPVGVAARLNRMGDQLAVIEGELSGAGFRVAAGQVDDALDDIDSALRILDADDPDDRDDV